MIMPQWALLWSSVPQTLHFKQKTTHKYSAAWNTRGLWCCSSRSNSKVWVVSKQQVIYTRRITQNVNLYRFPYRSWCVQWTLFLLSFRKLVKLIITKPFLVAASLPWNFINYQPSLNERLDVGKYSHNILQATCYGVVENLAIHEVSCEC